jgi:hypothetical protein
MNNPKINNEKTIKELVQNIVTSVIALVAYFIGSNNLSESTTIAISAIVWIIVKTIITRYTNLLKHSKDEQLP